MSQTITLLMWHIQQFAQLNVHALLALRITPGRQGGDIECYAR